MKGKLVVYRDESGRFDLSEEACTRINHLDNGRERLRLPAALMSEASVALITAAHRVGDRTGWHDGRELALVVKTRPQLAKLTSAIAVPDDEEADIIIQTR